MIAAVGALPVVTKYAFVQRREVTAKCGKFRRSERNERPLNGVTDRFTPELGERAVGLHRTILQDL